MRETGKHGYCPAPTLLAVGCAALIACVSGSRSAHAANTFLALRLDRTAGELDVRHEVTQAVIGTLGGAGGDARPKLLLDRELDPGRRMTAEPTETGETVQRARNDVPLPQEAVVTTESSSVLPEEDAPVPVDAVPATSEALRPEDTIPAAKESDATADVLPDVVRPEESAPATGELPGTETALPLTDAQPSANDAPQTAKESLPDVQPPAEEGMPAENGALPPQRGADVSLPVVEALADAPPDPMRPEDAAPAADELPGTETGQPSTNAQPSANHAAQAAEEAPPDAQPSAEEGMPAENDTLPPQRNTDIPLPVVDVPAMTRETPSALPPANDTMRSVDSAGEPEPLAPTAVNDDQASLFSNGFKWTLAPIRWGGNLAADIRLWNASEQPRRVQHVETANITARSYIWQPWFAQVGGGLGLVTSRERSSDNGGLTSTGAFSSDSTSVTGNGTLSVFPMSRFPFQAMLDVSDSRASGEFTGSDFTNTRMGLRQSYRPLEGNANYVVRYDRSILDSTSFGRDTVDVLAGSMNRRFGVQSIDISGDHTRNLRSTTGESSLLNRLTALHNYRPEATLSVDSFASHSSTNFHLVNDDSFVDNHSRFTQLNSFATWRPEEGSPLYVTGGGRLFQSNVDVNGTESESRSLNANIAATYALNRNVNFMGSASLTEASSVATRDLLTNQTVGVNYASDVITLGKFTYNANAGGNLSNQTGGRESDRQNVAGQLGHNLTRNLPLSAASALTFNLGQGYAADYDTVTAESQTLSHNAGISWRVTPNQNSTAYFGLSGADSRTFGRNESEFQMVNLQATGQFQFSQHASGTANLTIQGTRQSTPGTPSAGFTFNSNGNVGYQHLRAFGVPLLRYYAIYNINDSQFKTRLLGDVNAAPEQVNQSLEQRLEYNIGRIEMRLSLRIAEIDGERNSLLFFRISRQFGDF